MTASLKKFSESGTLFIWLCGAGLAASLFMIAGLLLLIMVNGLGYFWPKNLVEFTLTDGTRILGEIVQREPVPGSVTSKRPDGLWRIQIKVGNRDVYGQDFQWVNETRIVSRTDPLDAVVLERWEWGDFFGRFKGIRDYEPVAGDAQAGWQAFLALIEEANTLRDRIHHIERDIIGDINYEIEHARLALRALELEGRDSTEKAALEHRLAEQERLYEQHTQTLQDLYARLQAHSVLMEDANGREVSLPIGQIIRALKPNSMTVLEKLLVYAGNVWTVLSDEPREANTEGGIFPAIFGTVLMVLIMSVAVVPFGVLAAFYLREYAEQGFMVRMIRIAVNNLAGVPSIVFGVFGLGFFVYTVGGTIDALFYPEAFPNPTFGTGGILWASLTLALMTVPVVIVSTEEGLSAVPREFREGSLALGATKLETMARIVFPCALPGILTGLILAVSRATGEVAPLMLTGVVKLAPALPVDDHFPFLHLERKFMHLGFHIYDVGFQSPNVEAAKPMVYVTTLILVLIVIMLNLTAIALRNRMRKRYAGSTV